MPSPLSQVESFFDRAKLAYKWKFNRWQCLRMVVYPGYGTAQKVELRVRVLDDPTPPRGAPKSFLQNIRSTIQRVETDEVPVATVRATFYGSARELKTDGGGFATFTIDAFGGLPEDKVWHPVELELVAPTHREQGKVIATGRVLIPHPNAAFILVSDLDDTVIRSGATSRLRMTRKVLLHSASSRTPMPGVEAFYQSLCRADAGGGPNPVFYLSSSPWNLFDLFRDFLKTHAIPAGPILLKDLGFSGHSLFGGDHEEHKLAYLRRLSSLYKHLPFVLIGDSGQKDPEIYRQFAKEAPERVRVIYIRDISAEGRSEELEEIAKALAAVGVPLVCVEDSYEAARHACSMGLLRENALPEIEAAVREEREKQQD